MKLINRRWFSQIVDRDSGNLYPLYIYSPPPFIPPPLGNSSLALYRGWRHIVGWHSNEICSLMEMMKVSAER